MKLALFGLVCFVLAVQTASAASSMYPSPDLGVSGNTLNYYLPPFLTSILEVLFAPMNLQTDRPSSNPKPMNLQTGRPRWSPIQILSTLKPWVKSDKMISRNHISTYIIYLYFRNTFNHFFSETILCPHVVNYKKIKNC
uniref:Secreted protein n=1 Tax=Cacopsylla melanoneura TaxID=428564 RepID=A0A8D8LCS6_9HEMI